MEKFVDKLIELITGGLFFEYPALIPVAIAVVTVVIAYRWYKYLWDSKGKRGFDLWRSVAAAGVAVASVLSLVGWLYYRFWGLPPSFTDDQIGILIAEVPDQSNREQQNAYQNALRFRVQHNSELHDVAKVRLMERPLPPDAEAQQATAVTIGRWLRAAFVLRPFVVEGTQELWLTVVNPQSIFESESRLGKFSSSQLADLDELRLPADITQLAEVTLALTLSKHGSYKEAAAILRNVLASEYLPEAARSRWALDFLRGNILFASRNFDEAAEEYKQTLRLRPDYAAAYNNLGNVLTHQDQYDDAIIEYKKALSLNPAHSIAQNNLGIALAQEGQAAAAMDAFKKALSLNPNYNPAHYNLGLALSHQGKYADAAAEYEKAISLKPDDADAYNNLGLTMAHQGQYAAAIDDFKKAISLNPNDAAAHLNLAKSLAQEGQADAAAEYEKGISLKPDNANVH